MLEVDPCTVFCPEISGAVETCALYVGAVVEKEAAILVDIEDADALHKQTGAQITFTPDGKILILWWPQQMAPAGTKIRVGEIEIQLQQAIAKLFRVRVAVMRCHPDDLEGVIASCMRAQI